MAHGESPHSPLALAARKDSRALQPTPLRRAAPELAVKRGPKPGLGSQKQTSSLPRPRGRKLCALLDKPFWTTMCKSFLHSKAQQEVATSATPKVQGELP